MANGYATDAPTVPKITSNFAILDVKVGRKALAKLIGERSKRSYNVPVTITGVIDTVHSKDDGVSIEFALDVSDVRLGKPTKIGPTDKLGRPWALAAEVKVGDVLIPDASFTCMAAGTRKVVQSNGEIGLAGLYVACKCKRHSLDGQLGHTPETKGALVGFYRG